MAVAALAGLDLVATAIMLIDQELTVHYANPAAENLFELSSKSLVGHAITEIFQDNMLDAAVAYARANHCGYTEHDLKIGAFGRGKLQLNCTITPVELEGWIEGRADSLSVQPPVARESAVASASATGRSANVSQGRRADASVVQPDVVDERALATAPADGRSANVSQGRHADASVVRADVVDERALATAPANGRSANVSQGRRADASVVQPGVVEERALATAPANGRSANVSQGRRADASVVQPGVVEERALATAPANGRSANVSQWLLLEFRHIEQQMRIAREERLLDQSQANRELIRNLAHEIKNPLGGIRGAAQLLERELERPNLHEYTQVIIKEADRLQSLMDRLLRPHRLPQPAPLNIHEVLERVRSLILAEYPHGINIRRDYDTSLPLLTGDKEQIIQVVLNIVRNAAQAMHGAGRIELRTRVARQVTVARKRHKHALELRINDTGPGVPPAICEHIFYPLVSGREGGSGLGLTLAQTYVAGHGGTITFESQPGNTTFILLLPVEGVASGN